MMPKESPFEQNLERLIRASCATDAQLTPRERERLKRRLAAAWRETLPPPEFPAGILAMLSGLLLLLAAAGVLWPWLAGAGPAAGLALGPLALLVLANLACLPIASLIIVFGRRSCLKT